MADRKMKAAKGAFDASIDVGITLFDTAEVYGSRFSFGAINSETLLGRFIKERKEKNPEVEVAVATKFAALPWRFGRQSVITALKDSLCRLGLSSVDLYQLHWPGVWGNEGYIDGLGDAVEMGLVKAVGVSNYSGALTGKYTPGNPPTGPRGRIYTPEFLAKLQPLLNRIMEIGQNYDKTPTQLLRPVNPQSFHTGTQLKNQIPFLVKYLRLRIDYSNTSARVTVDKELFILLLDTPVGNVSDYFSYICWANCTSAHGYQTLVPVPICVSALDTVACVVLNWLICQENVVPIPGAKNAEQAKEFSGALGWRLTDDEINELRSLASETKPVIGFPVENL
ncbi:putative oxidoreductase, chloroplastic [Vitis vinifera]|uniref:Putative oxidoreductase, chloroplastic n=1 Tax=Vitis vinifera TaxID=29760 RepID=A0A438HCX0_VITVI|nr:putative oxidoreductase, chloroplastic [Vitis vinifera]